MDRARADHRDPAQWEFYPVRADQLPEQKKIGLSRVRKLAEACDIGTIRSELRKLAAIA